MSNDSIKISSKGTYNDTLLTLRGIRDMSVRPLLTKYAKLGVEYLQNATPIDSGETRDSWYYEITGRPGSYKINFCNNNTNKGINIAILLEYGHATRNGGWVEGRKYIGSAIAQTFDELTEELYSRIRRY